MLTRQRCFSAVTRASGARPAPRAALMGGAGSSCRIRPTLHARPRPAMQTCTQALPKLSSAVEGAITEDGGKDLATYVGLGLAAASFVFTFFVLPQFRELLKEPVQWSDIYKALVKAGNVKGLPAGEAYARSKRGAVLVDVRLQQRYEIDHAERAVSAPLYRPIQGWDAPSTLRRVAFSLFGIFPGTELNPDFLASVQAVAPKGKEVVVLCENGGSLENKPGTKYGFQSRSLKAAYFLQQAGYNKVSFCQGGYPQWQREDLPIVSGDDEASEEGAKGGLFGR